MHIRAAVSVIAASLGASVAGAGIVVPSHETESVPPLLDLAPSPTWQPSDEDDKNDAGRGSPSQWADSPVPALRHDDAARQINSTLASTSPHVLFEDSLLNAIAADEDASSSSAAAYSGGPLSTNRARHASIAIDDPVSVPLPPLTMPAMVTLSLAVLARRRVLPN